MIKTKHRFISDSYVFDSTSYKEQKNLYEPESICEMPVFWSRAQDFYVFDDQGNKWIDTTSGIFVANAGHSNPKIKEAIQNQLDNNLLFAYQYNTTIRHKFLEKLFNILPAHFTKSVLLNSGSEATDCAYRLIKLWGAKNDKKYIVTFTGSYHGRVLGSDLMGGSKDSTNWSRVKDKDVVFLEFPYEEQDLNLNDLPPLNEISAFFLETYQGWGAWPYPQKYIDTLYQISRDNNILFCFDEVQAGFYRMGPLFGYMTYGDYEPDLICVGKGITSSLPLSAVLSRKEIIDIDSTANLSSTHAGNALCCAAGLANLEFLTQESFQKELKEKCKYFENKCNELSKYSAVKRVNAKGLVAAIILDDKNIATAIVEDCIKEGVLIMNTKRESLKLGPPLTITTEALEEVFAVLENSIIKNELDI